MGRTSLALVALASSLAAQSVGVRDGRIVYVEASGRERLISSGPDDRAPSLSEDARSVVFVRATETAPFPNQPHEKQVLASEIRVADASGAKSSRLVFAGSVRSPGGAWLSSFSGPEFSPGGGYVYFLAEFAATSFALCRVDVERRTATFLTGGVIRYGVLHGGPYRGQLVAAIRTAPTRPEDGYVYPYYLLDPAGETIRLLAEESVDLESVVRQLTIATRPSP